MLLTACMTTNTAKISDPAKMLAIAGVTILPLQEQNWHIISNTKQQLAMVKPGKKEGETYAVNVSLFKVPPADTIDEFLEQVKKQRSSEPDTGRFKVLSNTEKIYKQSCIEHQSLSKDFGAIGKINTEYMLLETFGYNCSHKHASDVGVNVEYSRRYYPDSRKENLQDNAQALISNIKLVPFQ